jgi:hypothetical protein
LIWKNSLLLELKINNFREQAKIIKKELVIHKIITILSQNLVYGFKIFEVGLFDTAYANLGKFVYPDKERISRAVANAIGLVANYICSTFFVVDWLQKFE